MVTVPAVGWCGRIPEAVDLIEHPDEVGPVDMENAKRTLTVILNPAAT